MDKGKKSQFSFYIEKNGRLLVQEETINILKRNYGGLFFFTFKITMAF